MQAIGKECPPSGHVARGKVNGEDYCSGYYVLARDIPGRPAAPAVGIGCWKRKSGKGG